MRIRAAVVRQKSGPFLIEEIDLQEPREDEVLVRVVACGLCHTDLVARDQHLPVPLPGVFGHEGAGIVERLGSRVKKVSVGDHVVMSYLSCGACGACKTGAPTHCASFFPANFFGARLDGSVTLQKGSEVVHGSFFGQSAFASHVLTSERSIVKVPKDIPLEILGPLGCGIQTGAGGVINSLQARPGSSIAVFGAGSVGMSAVMAAVVSGCTRIIAVDIIEERLAMARTLGATQVIDSSTTDPVQAIRDTTGAGVDYSLECTGIPQVLRQAFDALGAGGICGLIGAAPVGAEVSLDMLSILNGRSLIGISEGDSVPDVFIPKLIDLFRQGRFPFDQMMKFYPFEQINEAAADSEKGRTLKAILRM